MRKVTKATGWLIAVGLLGWFCVAGCGKSPESSSPPAPPPAAPPLEKTLRPAPPETTTAPQPSRELEKLKGRWLRPDGGYILEIKQVDAQGRLEAAYFNPDPIMVTNAIAKMEGADVKLLVELSGQNYPGSRYELTFITAAGLMAGTYYQAATKQTFDVVFERAR
jgi:hypothetical protein